MRDPRQASKLSGDALFDYALRALGRRALTQAELKAKLQARSLRDRDVVEVMKRLRGFGYLDDRRVAESHSAFRRDTAVVGRKKVLAELKRRGVSATAAERAVSEAYRGADETRLAREHLRRKLGALGDSGKIEDRKQIARLFRNLSRAGFEPEAISSALRSVATDIEFIELLTEAASSEGGDV